LISDWASEETPLFGARRRALGTSDDLRTATNVGMLVSTLALPGIWGSTLKRVLVEKATVAVALGITQGIKDLPSRQQPDASDEESFPSGHSSQAFAAAAMGSMNIDTLTLQEPVQTGLRWGLRGLAAGTAWARVESGVHFPSNVLAGAALGNFMGRLIQHAFLGEWEGLRLGLYFGSHETLLSLSFAIQ
jgi:membrane-associated phospholipid phosphatase